MTKVTGSGSSSIAVAQETLAGIYNAAAGTDGSIFGRFQHDAVTGRSRVGTEWSGTVSIYRRVPAVDNDLESRPATDRWHAEAGTGTFKGASITNLALDGITLTNTLPVTGTLNVTNSTMTGRSR